MRNFLFFFRVKFEFQAFFSVFAFYSKIEILQSNIYSFMYIYKCNGPNSTVKVKAKINIFFLTSFFKTLTA